MELLFATSNLNKVKEISAMLPQGWRMLSLTDLGIHEDIPETSPTLEGNAEQKARYLLGRIGKDVMAEDTGLEVDALNGAPGVYSARYAGEAKDMEKNMALLLKNMEGVSDRSARFKTVISLYMQGTWHQFTGILAGSIGFEKMGESGFGYDPVFVLPDGRSLATLSAEEKNRISHRGKAVKKLLDFLKSQ